MKVIGKALINKQGFTLIELLVGIVIMGIVLGAIYTVSVVFLRSQQYNFANAANVQDERQIIMRISYEIRNATSINAPTGGSSANSILYKIANDTANRTITLRTGADANTILLKDPNGIIIKRLGTGQIKALQFTSYSTITRKITINLTMKSLPITNTPGNSISTSVYTLN